MASAATSPKIICRVKALYSFTSTEKSSLSFEKNDYIDVLSQLDSGWWDGWCKGNRGWFPSNYVKVVDINSGLIKEMRQDHQNSARQRKNTVNSNVTSPTVASYSSRFNDSEDDSEEEARTINLIRNMNNPTDLAKINTVPANPDDKNTSILTKHKPKHRHDKNNSNNSFHHPHSQAFYHRQHNQASDEEQEANLPDGWSLRIAEDGITKFYVNQKTGGLRWNHPGICDSDNDSSNSSDDESEMTLINHSKGQDIQILENLDAYDDFGAIKAKYKETPSTNLTDEEPKNLMSSWSKRTTPQGKVYYGNSITHETTWNYEDIDPLTGRLRTNKPSTDDHNVTEINELASQLTFTNEEPINWKSTTAQIAQSVQELNIAFSKGSQSDILKIRIANVVGTIRHMLYSSRSMDKDAPHLQEGEVKESLRVVLSTLAKLILSAKVIKESADVNNKLQRDASEVLSAVRRFVLLCQSKKVGMEQINPKLIVFCADNDFADKVKTRRKSSATSSSTITQKSKYPLNQDLIVSLQTHAKQIIGSADALCKAATYIHSLEQKKNQPQDSDSGVSREGESPISGQRSRSNVILLFQNLSSQIGTYLAILGEIDIVSQIDMFQALLLNEFRCNKQKLYNHVGLLFGAVQTITDTELDISTSVMSVKGFVKSIEEAIASIASNVAQMVEERRAWLSKNGYNMNDGGPWSPSHSFFDIDSKKGSSIRNNSLEENSDMLEELNLPRIQRLYSKQNKGQTQIKQPSSTSAATTLTRPADKPLTRQYSFAQGSNNNGAPEDKSQFWFLRYDYDESDIEFTQEGGIKGGTLPVLIERLTLHDFIDMSYIANFLLTYRSFCTTEDFVDLLQQRYSLSPPDSLTPDELEIWTDKKQKLVRLRVFNVMKNWLENYYNDEDEFILNKLQFFANTVIYDSSSFSAEQLNKLIRKRRELAANGGGLKKLIPNAAYGPTPIMPKNIQHIRLLETDPLELARQLSIMDFKLYSSILPIECLGKAWSGEGTDNAVNIKQSIDYCNRLTSWVTGSILSNKEAKKRVVVIKYWSQVANRCLEMNNYNTCMAILSAFDNSAIGRLKRTWELVSSRTTQSLAQIRKLMGSNRNFTEYREMIHSVNPPCIPFLGIYLQDLTFIEDGNPDFLKSSNCLINFAKQQMSAEVIREIKQFQSPPYNFHFVPEIQEYIKNQLEASRDVDFLYERSLELEPRVTLTTENSA